MIFRSSCGAPCATGWPSTHFDCRAATKQYAKIVRYIPNLIVCLVAYVIPGQAALPDSCPVCEHNPVSPDLCKPNKALRTTLKAFLRTEEKKREKDRPSATPAPALSTPTETETAAAQDLNKIEAEAPVVASEAVVAEESAAPPAKDQEPLEAPMIVPQPADQVCYRYTSLDV